MRSLIPYIIIGLLLGAGIQKARAADLPTAATICIAHPQMDTIGEDASDAIEEHFNGVAQ